MHDSGPGRKTLSLPSTCSLFSASLHSGFGLCFSQTFTWVYTWLWNSVSRVLLALPYTQLFHDPKPPMQVVSTKHTGEVILFLMLKENVSETCSVSFFLAAYMSIVKRLLELRTHCTMFMFQVLTILSLSNYKLCDTKFEVQKS